jgi:DNA-binding beta-propeller fold protein YncE
MKSRTAAGGVALVTVAAALAATGTGPASGASQHRAATVKVITRHLDGPFGLVATKKHGFVVAESESGQVTRVGPHGVRRVLFDHANGVAGVAIRPHRVFAVLGGDGPEGPAPAGRYKASSVLRSDARGHHIRAIADLAQYELDHNPDGQVQFVHGQPVDALSNPFSMTNTSRGLLVADGGANDVLRVNPRTGRISTFFVPPTVKDVAACLAPGAQANPGTVGCDPVPTGVTAARGAVYVSTLGAEVPGAGRVYKLNPRTGRVLHVWKGLTAPTGIAVNSNGAIFVSEVLFGAPQGQPPAGFDPSTVGRLTRIYHGRVTHSHVTMPTGLSLRSGRLWSSAWSVASFLGIRHAGQVVRVRLGSFH